MRKRDLSREGELESIEKPLKADAGQLCLRRRGVKKSTRVAQELGDEFGNPQELFSPVQIERKRGL